MTTPSSSVKCAKGNKLVHRPGIEPVSPANHWILFYCLCFIAIYFMSLLNWFVFQCHQSHHDESGFKPHFLLFCPIFQAAKKSKVRNSCPCFNPVNYLFQAPKVFAGQSLNKVFVVVAVTFFRSPDRLAACPPLPIGTTVYVPQQTPRSSWRLRLECNYGFSIINWYYRCVIWLVSGGQEYRHGFTLEFGYIFTSTKRTYFSTLIYINHKEKLEYRFFISAFAQFFTPNRPISPPLFIFIQILRFF